MDPKSLIELFDEFVENIPVESPEKSGFLLGFVLVVVWYVIFSCFNKNSRRPKRGYGAGTNNNWNRNINIAQPEFESKHHKLEHVWKYVGPGDAVPDMDICMNAPLSTPSCVDPETGITLSGHLIGRQTWVVDKEATAAAKKLQDSFTFNPSVNPNAGDKVFRAQALKKNGGNPEHAQPPVQRGAQAVASLSPEEALKEGWDFFIKLQCEDGHWAGDYGGPLFLLPGLILMAHITGLDLGAERKSAMLTYIRNHQQADGGWGLHIEGPGTLFCSTLNYCAARSLGVPASDPMMVAGRAFLHKNGGAVALPQWGKFWLAQLGAFEWEGVNPIPPELWLLPYWFPFHPGKLWCHYRMNYLPMSAIYGSRWGVPNKGGALGAALREELFSPETPYESVQWSKIRSYVADTDLYAPHTLPTKIAFYAIRAWEKYAPRCLAEPLSRRAIAFAVEYCAAEDMHTNWVDIGPVNKVFNMLVAFYSQGPHSEQFRRHIPRLNDYLWVAEDGMKMQGYNGSQLWDTAFAAQALQVSGLAPLYPVQVARLHSYLDASQIKVDVPLADRFFRTPSKGGWPFSTNDHGWPIADCTAEGLRATIAIRELVEAGQAFVGTGEADGRGTMYSGLIPINRLGQAVDILLTLHNPDEGGWATYEPQRGGSWYELFNPAEIWADLMVDYQYTELTCASLTGLIAFRKVCPGPDAHRAKEVDKIIQQGVDYVRAQQREDGAWYGSWAVCFTYGAWFGVEALVKGGDPKGIDREALEKTCTFLLSKQNEDGGWGETYLSCLTKEYSANPSSVVNTAWALMALMNADCKDSAAVDRGIAYLMASQSVNGDWTQQNCSGIFNRTCTITYTTYRNVFPLWAIATYVNSYKYRSTNPVLFRRKDDYIPSLVGQHVSSIKPIGSVSISENPTTPSTTIVRKRAGTRQ